MGKHSHMHARWSVTAALLLLVTSLAPGLALAAHSRISPLASPSPVARTLDLAAMALTPVDLDDIGLTGFGQQMSAFLDLEEQAEQLTLARAVDPGTDEERAAVVSGLAAAGFQQRYQRQLGLPAHPGAPPSRLRTFVAPYVIEYASVEGAAAGFTLLETGALEAGAATTRCAGHARHRRPLRDHPLSAGIRQRRAVPGAGSDVSSRQSGGWRHARGVR